ncbi:MAG: diaminopimelate epimerase [Mycobacteriales bacterium]
MRWIKGHGTQNDFLLLPDGDPLPPALVRALCDRRAGLGADGVLRVVPAADDPDGAPMAAEAEWFMDYRNADGSVAEMCGNGARVFARHLVDAGLAEPGELRLATRGGLRTVWLAAAGDVTVDMGVPAPIPARPTVGGRQATAVSMGNPHVVVPLAAGEPGLAELAGLCLTRPPDVTPALPDGQNVEFTVRVGPRALVLRVHERGVGETQACGTGVCAAVVATIQAAGEGRDQPWAVDVPGGRLTVVWTAAGPVRLAGPAVLVATGETRPDWLATITA